MKNFEPGTVVVFDPTHLNPNFWIGLSEEDKIKFYGDLGYGQNKKKFFIFLCEVKNARGHCVLVDMDGKIQTMRHTEDFREVTQEEF